MCDAHHVVFAEGCAAETLYPGQIALDTVDKDARDEIVGLLPDVPLGRADRPMARYTLKRHEAKALLGRAA